MRARDFSCLQHGTCIALGQGWSMTMRELVGIIYEYRNLLGRRDLLGLPQSTTERHRLEALERHFETTLAAAGTPIVPASLRRRFARFSVRIPAQVKVGSHFQPTEIVNLGAGGLVVKPAPTLRRGSLTVLRIKLAALGREYQFPCQARWLSESLGRSALGLSFAGLPIELRFGVGCSENFADAA